MTREEEIRQAGIEYTIKNRPVCISGGAFSEIADKMNRNHAFEKGAEWADKTMIDKICNWLLDNTGKYMVVSGGGYWFNDIEFIKDFRRYLEN
jgi:hypothetical protein